MAVAHVSHNSGLALVQRPYIMGLVGLEDANFVKEHGTL